MLLRETFPAGPFECNCTILACGDTKDAVVIDPGGEIERIAEIVAQYDLAVRAIVHTHAHLDHIYCTRDVKDRHGGTICLHRGDAFLYDGFAAQAAMFGWQVRDTRPVERWIEDGDRIELGKRELDRDPHARAHAGLGVLRGRRPRRGPPAVRRRHAVPALRRPHRPARRRLRRRSQRSIKERLYTRDLDTLVVPGHGPTTQLGDEARGNPFVRA